MAILFIILHREAYKEVGPRLAEVHLGLAD